MSGLPDHLRPITIDIPATWSAEQALAVFDLIDGLRDAIWARYGGQLQELLAEQQQTPDAADSGAERTDSARRTP